MAIVKRDFIVWTFFVLLLLSFTVSLYSFLPPSCSSSSSTLHTIRNELDISKLTTLEVEDYVKKQKEKRNGKAAIVLSIGATEQHGPTGLIGTDQLTAKAVASQVCNDCDVLLGPHLPVGNNKKH